MAKLNPRIKMTRPPREVFFSWPAAEAKSKHTFGPEQTNDKENTHVEWGGGKERKSRTKSGRIRGNGWLIYVVKSIWPWLLFFPLLYFRLTNGCQEQSLWSLQWLCLFLFIKENRPFGAGPFLMPPYPEQLAPIKFIPVVTSIGHRIDLV